MSDFFNGLGDVLSQQFSLGDNKLKSLDIVKNGHTVPYGKLGNFASQFDQSSERQYTEEGWYRTDLFNPKVKQLELLMQEPDVTILVKKRAFASLADNYRIDLSNDEEALFIRATKFLFQNKCKQIAAYEKLTKIQSVATEIGELDHHLLPSLFSATDTLSSAFSGSSSFGKFKAVIDRIKTITNLSGDKIYTTWTTNQLNSFRTDLGEGTGVIEFTTALSVNTTVSNEFGGGSFSITFSDPHELMRITHNDIEQAIADAKNTVTGNSFVQLGLNSLNQGIQADKISLNKLRAKRGANPINFIVNPDTYLGKRIRTIIDGSGIEIQFTGSIFEVNIDPLYFRGGALAGEDGLDPNSYGRAASLAGVVALTILNPIATITNPEAVAESVSIKPNSEAAIFSRIIRDSLNQLQLNKNSQTVKRIYNGESNALRKKLRLHYGTKLIIQPMDAVHIFVSSKTTIDNKIIGGLQDSLSGGFLQSANKALMNLKDFFQAGTNDSIEKSLSVGRDFPNWLWLIMRNQFIKDKSGSQIFAGIVEHNTSNYDNNGTFNVSVSGNDNAAYFKFGVVNLRPATDVFNGSLYDPLTPFDIKFDRATGLEPDEVPDLLQENQELFKSKFVKYKNGNYVGRKPTQNNFTQDSERIQNTSIRRVFYDPDGMVYKWKEGIGSLVMFGNTSQESATNTSSATITTDPFAGQDIMNALSLLVTGEPYNFATFYKAARQVDSTGRDAHTGADPSASFFKNFQTDLKSRNLLYGNFVPFKKLTMDSETYKNVINYQINASAFDSQLNALLAQKADLSDKFTFFSNGGDVTTPVSAGIDAKLKEIDIKITAKTDQIQDELKKIEQPLSIIGNDITLEYDPFLNGKDSNKLDNIYQRNKELRRKIHYLTRRMSWKVRANEDMNLFIIDDSYDKDYDIQAFEKAFSNPSLFKSDYITVAEKIKQIAGFLDLEIFADSQGNIQVRPPQYNKMPSSVFYRMFRLKDEFNVQIYPQFLEDLYVDQITNILSRIEILEDEIRMYGIALSRSSDADLSTFISITAFDNFRGPTVSFEFISDEDTGFTSKLVLHDLSIDNDTSSFEGGLNALNSVETQATINNIFSVSSRVNVLKTLTDSKININENLYDSKIQTRKDAIIKRISAKTGHTFNLKSLFPGSDKQKVNVSSVEMLRITQEISVRISERQRILKIAALAIKNAKESLSLIQNKNKNGNKIITSPLLNNKNFPQAFENLIEDETYDDYGANSGQRYVLKNHHIKSMSIKEAAPPFTAVEVQGRFADNFTGINPPADLNGFQNGGNALTTATAVDYDLWRMYGIRLPQTVEAPYLTNPTTQCAPFAVALLNKARKQIQTGTINIVGNEYMQTGEVVYIENQDMLFYIVSVNHSINYGKSFSTTLNVAYGHMPGEYIPTYLDTVGKILYKNKDITSMVHLRQSNVNSEQHIGTIVGGSHSSDAGVSIMQGIYANPNRQALNQILSSALSAFAVGNANYIPILELRIFAASDSGFAEDSSGNANLLAQAVQSFLIGENNMYALSKDKQPDKLLGTFGPPSRGGSGQIRIVSVNADSKDEFRTPSSTAYSVARTAVSKKGNVGSSTSIGTDLNNIGKAIIGKPTTGATSVNTLAPKVDQFIYTNIVDCWIYLEKKA